MEVVQVAVTEDKVVVQAPISAVEVVSLQPHPVEIPDTEVEVEVVKNLVKAATKYSNFRTIEIGNVTMDLVPNGKTRLPF